MNLMIYNFEINDGKVINKDKKVGNMLSTNRDE